MNNQDESIKGEHDNKKSENKSFLEQLKEEHHQILGTLQEVKKNGAHTMDGRNALTAAKDLMCMHFKKEDDILYPELNKSAKSNKHDKQVIKRFIEEMKKVTQFCDDFFQKYSISGGGIEFLRDFEKLYAMLETRLQKEETVLYPKYAPG